MINIVKATEADLETVLSMRYEMLRAVNQLSDYEFDDSFQQITRDYFENGNQTTVLAYDGETPVGCATICYINLMPTFGHRTGKRAHFMNVYTREEYRRQGIAKRMMEILMDEAKEKGVTHLGLDASDAGRPLYYHLGFFDAKEAMERIVNAAEGE